MRVIINDKRYGALKTLGERKQAFNEVSLWVNFRYKIHIISMFLNAMTIRPFSSQVPIEITYVIDLIVHQIFLLLLQYLGQRKKQEAEERRIKQKKAKEDFTRMLEVSYILLR